MKSIDAPLLILIDPYTDDPEWVAAKLSIVERGGGTVCQCAVTAEALALLVQQGAAALGKAVRNRKS